MISRSASRPDLRINPRTRGRLMKIGSTLTQLSAGLAVAVAFALASPARADLITFDPSGAAGCGEHVPDHGPRVRPGQRPGRWGDHARAGPRPGPDVHAALPDAPDLLGRGQQRRRPEHDLPDHRGRQLPGEGHGPLDHEWSDDGDLLPGALLVQHHQSLREQRRRLQRRRGHGLHRRHGDRQPVPRTAHLVAIPGHHREYRPDGFQQDPARAT